MIPNTRTPSALKAPQVEAAPATPIGPHQAERRARIEQAAFDLLSEVGYRSASILAIAKRAHASNDTLYQWYGSKPGLFAALVARNAADARTLLESVENGQSALLALQALGPILLRIVTSESAVRLNRAAAADVDDGNARLGQALARHGREALAPRLASLMLRLGTEAQIDCPDQHAAEDCTETYLALLLGDWQIRRAIGAMVEPTPAACEARAERAFAHFMRLHGTFAPDSPSPAPQRPAARSMPAIVESLLDPAASTGTPPGPDPDRKGKVNHKGKGKGGKSKKLKQARRRDRLDDRSDARSQTRPDADPAIPLKPGTTWS